MADQPIDAKIPAAKRRRLQRYLVWLFVVLVAYAFVAYVVLPVFWTHYEHQKGLADLPMVTRTAQGIPGDPINVGLIGNEKEVLCAMHGAGWFPGGFQRISATRWRVSSSRPGPGLLPADARSGAGHSWPVGTIQVVLRPE